MKKLRRFLLIGAFLVLISAGCATTPPENPWAELTTETEPTVAALDCGAFPLPTRATDTEITYNETGTNALEAYRLCSEANEANVDEHAAQIAQLKIARQGLTEAGQAQRNIATMRQEMLDDERKHHLWQSVGYWAVIIGMGLAL